ncbi:MAG: PIN domain-containing protein [Azospirillaceae bacterium]|nr:PIN domain-containing protein [Azospirillaceae bacterium]
MPAGRRVYVDTNIIIYQVEGQPDLRQKLANLFIKELDGAQFLTSQITIAECLLGAHKRGDAALVETYREIFGGSGVFQLIPVGLEILERAALFGAQQRLKLIDAVHVASALTTGCDTFLTNDAGIRCDDIRVIQLDGV